MTPGESHPDQTEIIAELQSVREVVEEFFILLDHIWRNRTELHQVFARPDHDREESMPQSIRCATCHTDAPDSVTAALEQGWSQLSSDDGPVGSYVGCCPRCSDRQRDEDQGMKDQAAELIDAEAFPFCCESPRLVWSGDPDYPGIVCQHCGFLAAENGSLVIRTEEELQAEIKKNRQEQKELF